MNTIYKAVDNRPRSEPALELHSRAVSIVGVVYRSSGPNTGSNFGGGLILKKKNSDLAGPLTTQCLRRANTKNVFET